VCSDGREGICSSAFGTEATGGREIRGEDLGFGAGADIVSGGTRWAAQSGAGSGKSALQMRGSARQGAGGGGIEGRSRCGLPYGRARLFHQ